MSNSKLLDSTVPHTQYKLAATKDLPDVARIFVAAFPESVIHYTGRSSIKPDVLTDVFAICLAAEPEAFFLAVSENQLEGYVFAPSNFSNVVRTAIFKGYILRMLGKWIVGKYDIGIHAIVTTIHNWFVLVKQARITHSPREGVILSIAVNPEVQGRGIGSGLMRAALHHLKLMHVDTVRLEVRPWNSSAIHLYQKFGFRLRARTFDTQGEWLVMIKEMAHDAEA